ncbi:hypothetical protein NPIL_250581 [Nephila pilipes]|uniref:Uncharacterized protein n=1 Tax=Nephila pilipes TaxID=299642 RepID=A0A8X6PZN0_NEPPI|nr:hypothetical protein NPIL_250581 [Nephila pilipes]
MTVLTEEVLANSVPAAAVIRRGLALFGIIGRKGRVGGLETASDKLEEGGDDVKSSWPLWSGLHTCYNGGYNGLQSREAKLIP